MAVNYDSLFKDIGEIIQGMNVMINDGSNDWLSQLDTGFTSISNEYDTNNKEDLLDNLSTTIDQVKSSVVGMAISLSGLVDSRIAHSSITDELSALGSRVGRFSDVLLELYKDMVDNTERVKQSVFALSSITKNSANPNVGTLLTTKYLIGAEAPSSGLRLNKYYGRGNPGIPIHTGTAQAGASATITLASGASSSDDLYNGMQVSIISGTGKGQARLISDYTGSTKVAAVGASWATNPDNTSVYTVRNTPVTSELAFDDDTFTAECVTDYMSENISGNESFILTGKQRGNIWGSSPGGSGSGPNLRPINGPTFNLIRNGDFESWTEGSEYNDPRPIGWEVVSGWTGGQANVGSTGLVRENTPSDVFHGGSSLKLCGYAGGGVHIRQNITNSLDLNTGFFISAYIKADSGTSSGTLKLRLENAEGELQTFKGEIGVASGGIGTSYALVSNFGALYEECDKPLYLSLTWDATSASDIIHIDYIGLAKAVYHGGIGIGVVAGADRFMTGDRLSTNVTYSTTGVFQDFFRKKYGMQFPSSSSPENADTLATDDSIG